MPEDLYQVESEDINSVRETLESILGTHFELHDSLHWGGDYYLSKSESLVLRLFVNCDFEDESITSAVEHSRLALLAYSKLAAGLEQTRTALGKHPALFRLAERK